MFSDGRVYTLSPQDFIYRHDSSYVQLLKVVVCIKSKHLNTNGINRQPRQAQRTGEARSAVTISLALHAVLLMPLKGHTGHEMRLYGLIASEKSCL